MKTLTELAAERERILAEFAGEDDLPKLLSVERRMARVKLTPADALAALKVLFEPLGDCPNFADEFKNRFFDHCRKHLNEFADASQ